MVLVTASEATNPFTQEASLTQFVLMSRSTKRGSRYHSLIVLTWLGRLAPCLLCSLRPPRLSDLRTESNKHKHSPPSRQFLLFPRALAHFLYTYHGCGGRFLSGGRLLTDVEATARSREPARLGWGRGVGVGVGASAARTPRTQGHSRKRADR